MSQKFPTKNKEANRMNYKLKNKDLKKKKLRKSKSKDKFHFQSKFLFKSVKKRLKTMGLRKKSSFNNKCLEGKVKMNLFQTCKS